MNRKQRITTIVVTVMVTLLVVALIIGAVNYAIAHLGRSNNRFYVMTDEEFPELRMSAENGDIYSIAWPQNGQKTVIFYMSSMCSSCTNHLPTIKKIVNTFSGSEWRFFILWEDSIPRGVQLANAANLLLKEDVALAGSTPSVFIVDDRGIVDFNGEYSTRNLVQVLVQNSKEQYLQRCIETLPNQDGDKLENLYAFHTRGCTGCKESSINIQKDAIRQKYNITILSDEDGNNIVNCDTLDFYSVMFDIQLYPMYLIVDKEGNYKVVDTL